MAALNRAPESAQEPQYDLVIVGGGVYGALLSLEGSQRGLRCLLLEREDFGSQASASWLRILHGGLRYLQSADLPRFFQSVEERSWWLRTFPHLTAPLPCLMPLDGVGLRRPSVMRAALFANDLLSVGRNRGLAPQQHLERGRVMDAASLHRTVRELDKGRFRGAAVWHDAYATHPNRLIVEILRRAVAHGACTLNYVEARTVSSVDGAVDAVEATDVHTGHALHFRTRFVINTAGLLGNDGVACVMPPPRQRVPACLAWNALFDVPPPSQHALAIVPSARSARSYFALPLGNKLLIGTGYAEWQGDRAVASPSAHDIDNFCADIDAAIPSLGVNRHNLLRIFAGLQPAQHDNPLVPTDRPIIMDHARCGVRNFFSVFGVKFTTARAVATDLLMRIVPSSRAAAEAGTVAESHSAAIALADPGELLESLTSTPQLFREQLMAIVAAESVLHLDDLLLRRTSLGDEPALALQIAPAICELLGWADRVEPELTRLRSALAVAK